ncbi:SMP-30/gluconolactonase/LRE family protein [Verrucomicrobiota bacterium]
MSIRSPMVFGFGVILVFLCMTSVRGDAAPLTNEKPNRIVSDTKVVKLARGFRFTEGPASDSRGNVYFSDIPASCIHKWSTNGVLTTFRKNTGRSNGLYFSRNGDLFVCEGGNRRVTLISKNGNFTIIADKYNGKKFNSPNDLWVDPEGGIYFTDPRYGKQDDMEQNGFCVYYIPPDKRTVIRVVDDLVKPNGIVGTADGKHLYVADPGDGKIYVYEITEKGLVKNRKLFVEEKCDGMTLDEYGNLYITSDSVLVYDKNGNRIANIEVPEKPSNVCFGGPNRQKLFITARTGLYAICMNVRGI